MEILSLAHSNVNYFFSGVLFGVKYSSLETLERLGNQPLIESP